MNLGGRFWANVLAVAYKETSALRHDRAFIAVVVIQPLILVLLFGFVLSNQPANVPWVVLDQSHTALSRRFLADVQATGYFLPPQSVDSYDTGQRRLRRGEAVALVVVPADFRRAVERGRPQVQVLVDGTDPITAARVGGIVAQVGASFDGGRGGTGPTPRLQPRQRFRFNPTLEDRRFFLAILSGFLLTNLCLSVASLGVVSEREAGTFEHMLSLPTTPLEIVLGKILPYVVIAQVLVAATTLAVGWGFDLWPRGSWTALHLAALPFTLATLAFGVLLSTLAANSVQAVFVGVFVMLPSFVLSGALFPHQLMPPGMREVSTILPLHWYQVAMRRIIERGAGISEVAVPILTMWALFAGLLLLIRWRLRPRLA